MEEFGELPFWGAPVCKCRWIDIRRLTFLFFYFYPALRMDEITWIILCPDGFLCSTSVNNSGPRIILKPTYVVLDRSSMTKELHYSNH
jgi:hypothetical protein